MSTKYTQYFKTLVQLLCPNYLISETVESNKYTGTYTNLLIEHPDETPINISLFSNKDITTFTPKDGVKFFYGDTGITDCENYVQTILQCTCDSP